MKKDVLIEVENTQTLGGRDEKYTVSVNGTLECGDRRHGSTAEALAALRAEGYRIVATTPHREDTTPESFDVGRGRFALVFGTEHAGISEEVLASADEFLRIPMCGMVESLNVSASAAILIYMLSERMRRQVEGWNMTAAEQAATLYGWMCRSVKDSEKILKRTFGEE